jgi:hypothetical protein
LHYNGEVVTAVVDEVDDNLKAACTQVKDEVRALQIYTQEHATVETGSPIDNDDLRSGEFSMRELIDAPMRAAIDDLVVTVVCLDAWHTVRGCGA